MGEYVVVSLKSGSTHIGRISEIVSTSPTTPTTTGDTPTTHPHHSHQDQTCNPPPTPKCVLRLATEQEEQHLRAMREWEGGTISSVSAVAEKMGYPITVIDVEKVLDGRRVFVYFRRTDQNEKCSAAFYRKHSLHADYIDFRKLQEKLHKKIFKCRVEMVGAVVEGEEKEQEELDT